MARTDWKAILEARGAQPSTNTTNTSTVTVSEEPAPRGYAEGEMRYAGAPPSKRTIEEFDKNILEWAAAGLELIGEQRLLAALDRAMGGTGRDRSAFDTFVERQLLDMTRAQADGWRERLWKLGGHKGCPTFCNDVSEVMDAITSGCAAQFGAERRATQLEADQLVWPEIELGEDQHVYLGRLQTWADDKPERVLKAARFDPYTISREAVEKRERAKRQVEVEMCREAIIAFHQSGDIAALRSVRAQVGSLWVRTNEVSSEEAVAGSSRFAWQLVASGEISPSAPTMAPSPEWLGAQTDLDLLIRCAQEAYCTYATPPRDYRGAFRTQLLLALPERLDETHAFVAGTNVITHKGEIVKLETYVWDPERTRRQDVTSKVTPGYLISTVPHIDGWVTIRPVKEFNDRVYSRATLYTHEHYQALQVALRCERGTFDARAWLANFGRHPQQGFGRFYFRVQPGGAHYDQMFVSVDDRLRDRIELLAHLPDPTDVGFPENIWWLPARLSSKKDKGGHMVWDDRPSKPMVAWQQAASWTQMSRRSTGGSISYKPTGTAPAWRLSASTSKHSHTMVVALVAEGQELHLESGIAVRYEDGKLVEVPGGALPPGQKTE